MCSKRDSGSTWPSSIEGFGCDDVVDSCLRRNDKKGDCRAALAMTRGRRGIRRGPSTRLRTGGGQARQKSAGGQVLAGFLALGAF
jgi:hypothetical protein